MKKFSNNRVLTIEDLEESGIYDLQLLQDIKAGNFKVLAELPIEFRSDIDYMEPLLYAVKNELDTYKVYKYYSESLQNDEIIGKEILKKEPELIENTPLSRNEQFIINNISGTPELLRYMDPKLKTDSTFVYKLSSMDNAEVLKEITKDYQISEIILNNAELRNDETFMSMAINKDASFLKFASNELKNDSNFLKKIFNKNYEAVEYTANNAQEFGINGLNTAKEVLVEESSVTAIDGFKEEYKKLIQDKEKHTEQDTEQDTEIKLEQKERREKEKKEQERRENQLQSHIKFMEKLRNGEIDPARAARLMNTLCKNLDPEYKKQIELFLKIDDVIVERQQNKGEISRKETVEATSKVRTSAIVEETNEVNEGIQAEKGEQAKEK